METLSPLLLAMFGFFQSVHCWRLLQNGL